MAILLSDAQLSDVLFWHTVATHLSNSVFRLQLERVIVISCSRADLCAAAIDSTDLSMFDKNVLRVEFISRRILSTYAVQPVD